MATGNPMDILSHFFPRGTHILNRTAWRGKEPRSCGVIRVKSRPHAASSDDTLAFDVEVAYRPKGVITFLGGTKYDGWTAMMLDQKKDGTLLDGHGNPLPEGQPPVYLPFEVYDDVEFNDIAFGEFVGEFEVETVKHVTRERVWQQFRESGGGSIGSVGPTFVAARRERPLVRIIITSGPSGRGVDGFATRIVNISKFTPHIQKVIMDELTEVVFGFLEGRYSISTLTFGDTVMIELDKLLVDCTPNEEGKASRFDCFGEYVSDTFMEELATLIAANFEVDVSIMDGSKGGLLLRKARPEK
jgi:hypothetical protein